ncbi:MAG: substrate-binding domain-containing protein [Gemmatimonadetes bacterium]|nr:substrate-binding domain-containing protein [Gemmatimonadota bacterium]
MGRRCGVALAVSGLLASATSAQQALVPRDLVLATTTSVRDAGLLDVLLPAFERATGRNVKVLAVGSGQAMEIGRRGDADVLIVHDPEREREFIADGVGCPTQNVELRSWTLDILHSAVPSGHRLNARHEKAINSPHSAFTDSTPSHQFHPSRRRPSTGR